MTASVAWETIAYKILTDEQLAGFLANGAFGGAPVDIEDGYIHMSTARQVSETLDKRFAGHVNLHIAAIDLQVLGQKVKWEPSRGGDLFPHLYARLPLSAVIAHEPVRYEPTGMLCLPTCDGRS